MIGRCRQSPLAPLALLARGPAAASLVELWQARRGLARRAGRNTQQPRARPLRPPPPPPPQPQPAASVDAAAARALLGSSDAAVETRQRYRRHWLELVDLEWATEQDTYRHPIPTRTVPHLSN